MPARVRSALLEAYRHLPLWARLGVVRSFTPSYHVGALCVIEREDGALLLLRQSYRRQEAWGFPGGLLKRGEHPEAAVRREVGEELGVAVELEEVPLVVVEPRHRRIDVIYRARLADGERDAPPKPRSPEVVEVRWFPPTDLPVLLPEAASAIVELGRSRRPTHPS